MISKMKKCVKNNTTLDIKDVEKFNKIIDKGFFKVETVEENLLAFKFEEEEDVDAGNKRVQERNKEVIQTKYKATEGDRTDDK